MIPLLGAALFAAAGVVLWLSERWREVDADVEELFHD